MNAPKKRIPEAATAHIERQRAKLFQLAEVAKAANLTFDSPNPPDMGHVLDLVESLVEDVVLRLDSEEIERAAKLF